MKLGRFTLDEPATRQWLAGNAPAASPLADLPSWNPVEVGLEADVIGLIDSAQRNKLLTGPGTLALLYANDPDGDVYRILVELTPDGSSAVRVTSLAHDWAAIVQREQVGIDAAMTILTDAVAEANHLLRDLESFTAPAERAAYDQARQESLEVTAGIERFSTCGCGDPVALYEDRWFHVYNDGLRGTDDHDPEPDDP